MGNLVPIDSVMLKGETVREELFINVGGGEKTILIFESGRVLIMPVYRKCPVQVGTIEDLRGDFSVFIQNLEADKQRMIKTTEETIRLIRGL